MIGFGNPVVLSWFTIIWHIISLIFMGLEAYLLGFFKEIFLPLWLAQIQVAGLELHLMYLTGGNFRLPQLASFKTFRRFSSCQTKRGQAPHPSSYLSGWISGVSQRWASSWPNRFSWSIIANDKMDVMAWGGR